MPAQDLTRLGSVIGLRPQNPFPVALAFRGGPEDLTVTRIGSTSLRMSAGHAVALQATGCGITGPKPLLRPVQGVGMFRSRAEDRLVCQGSRSMARTAGKPPVFP